MFHSRSCLLLSWLISGEFKVLTEPVTPLALHLTHVVVDKVSTVSVGHAGVSPTCLPCPTFGVNSV